jgi:hypothetical protein
MRGSIIGLLAAALICVCGVARSAPIVYNVDITDGFEAVSGTITTDGLIGSLAMSDIISWTLSASGDLIVPSFGSSDPGAYIDCSSCPALALTATPSSLIFDFGGQGFVGFNVVVLPHALGLLLGGIHEHWSVRTDSSVYDTFVGSSPQVIATASVPEPATVALLGLALACIGFARKRSRGRQSTAV